MLLVRIGSQSRWSTSEPSIERAVKDLRLRPEEEGLSVYKVDSIESARSVAKLFAPTARKSVSKIDFIVFDDSLVPAIEGLTLRKTGCDLHPELSGLHHEIVGLDDQNSCSLAAAILSSSFSAERVSESELIESVRCRTKQDDQFKAYVHEDWIARAVD
jgi:hypothetical protein